MMFEERSRGSFVVVEKMVWMWPSNFRRHGGEFAVSEGVSGCFVVTRIPGTFFVVKGDTFARCPGPAGENSVQWNRRRQHKSWSNRSQKDVNLHGRVAVAGSPIRSGGAVWYPFVS